MYNDKTNMDIEPQSGMVVHQTDYTYQNKIVGWKPQLLSHLFKQPWILLAL
jgi:hypothetical protein